MLARHSDVRSTVLTAIERGIDRSRDTESSTVLDDSAIEYVDFGTSFTGRGRQSSMTGGLRRSPHRPRGMLRRDLATVTALNAVDPHSAGNAAARRMPSVM